MTESRKSAANLPTKESELMDIAGHGVALKTWASYRSAERMLATYMKENRMKLELPIEKHTITGFVHWLIFKKKVKSGTVSNYLAGVRMLHVVKGMDPPELRDNFIKLVLTGKKNQEAAARLRGEASPERQPVSLDVLRLIKARLRAHSCHAVDKLTIWACCTILFHGAFRGGELLAKSSQQFDPAFTLLRKDDEDDIPRRGSKVVASAIEDAKRGQRRQSGDPRPIQDRHRCVPNKSSSEVVESH